MELLFPLIPAVMCGYYVQTEKRRTGLFWGVPIYFGSYWIVAKFLGILAEVQGLPPNADPFRDWGIGGTVFLLFMVHMMVTILIGLLLMTLPKGR